MNAALTDVQQRINVKQEAAATEAARRRESDTLNRIRALQQATGDDHLHLVCRDCGSVTETDVSLADGLVGRLADQHGFQTDVAHFAIYGRCQACSS